MHGDLFYYAHYMFDVVANVYNKANPGALNHGIRDCWFVDCKGDDFAGWADYIICLADCIINHIQMLFSRFLWNGNLNTRSKAKVSWVDVTLPFEEGGLGIKDAHEWNKSLILKHLYLSLTQFQCPCGLIGSTKLSSKRLLSGSQRNRENVPGSSSKCWIFGNWQLRTSVIKLVMVLRFSFGSTPGTMASPFARLTLILLLLIVVCLRTLRYLLFSLLLADVCPLPVTIPCWSGAKVFSEITLITEISMIHFYRMKGRVHTLSKLKHFGTVREDSCYFCINNSETIEHLFLECPFTQFVFNQITHGKCLPLPTNWDQWQMELLIQPPDIFQTIRILIFQVGAYAIWRERNNRFHQDKLSAPAKMAAYCTVLISSRLVSSKWYAIESVKHNSLQVWSEAV
ncbi:hypothetical protein POM88_033722 [Heracleum sosnowskyi]|uniref:Reverse transcriptase zinc-binding domain-containing protein n=1 Tax=Heracleum sosnowskyi TaxID=360622 RepID=A0AAD8HKB3_9APIA|nr:hypothetical protein POM88_033722 [Heracleum sosnowskyi]